MFNITLKVNGLVLEGKGKDMLEAIQNIPKPLKVSTKGVLNIVNGDKKKEVVLMPIRLRRLFHSSSQVYMAKQLAYGM